MKTLRDAKIGETVKVVKLHGEGAVKRRLVIRSKSRCAATNCRLEKKTPV